MGTFRIFIKESFDSVFMWNIINYQKNQKKKFLRQNLVTKLAITSINKINITSYFENLTVQLYVLYTLNTHVKFYINYILFTI